jgi:hypothetical protein
MDDEWTAPVEALLKAIERTADAVGDGATVEDARVLDTLVSAYTRLLLVRPAHEPDGDGHAATAPGTKMVKEAMKEVKEADKMIKELDKMKESEAGFAPPPPDPIDPDAPESTSRHFIRPEHRPDVGPGS